MEKLLQEKVALVTGGTRGIGRAIVLELAAQGAHVAFTFAGSVDRAANVVKEIEALGVQGTSIQSDAADFSQAQAVVDQVVEKHGRLDILVNNAGITRDNLLLRLKEEDWDQVLATNLKSVFNYTKAVSRTMMKQRDGVVVNLSSVVGVGGNAGQSNYAASKAGIIGFSKSMAKELGSRNIRTNVVAPGFIATEMTDQLDEKQLAAFLENIPLNRPGKPEEVAQLVAFLAGPYATYINGQVLVIDGGMS